MSMQRMLFKTMHRMTLGTSAFIMFKGWQQTPAMAFNDTDIKF